MCYVVIRVLRELFLEIIEILRITGSSAVFLNSVLRYCGFAGAFMELFSSYGWFNYFV
jgi:hypothetical protein